MSDFVTNYVTDCSEVHILRSIVVVEDVSENASGDDNGVGLRPVEGVYIGCVGEVAPTVRHSVDYVDNQEIRHTLEDR